MVLKFTKEQFKNGLKQAAGGKPFFKVQKALKEAGLGKFLHQSSVSKDQFKKVISALREQGLVRKQVGEVIRVTEKKIATKAESGEKPKEKISLAELREQREAEEKKKEEMAKRMAIIYGRERAKEAEEEKQKAVTSAALRTTAKTSALAPQKAPGRPETTTSALRKSTAPKPVEEKKPQIIDLPID